MPPTALVVEELGFDQFGPFSLTLQAGECIGLSGPSGSGKTRLLRSVADLDVHTGCTWLDGVPCEDIPPPAWRRQVALLPAESAWWHDDVGAHFLQVPTSEKLESLGFDEDVMTWRVDRLSSGEKQRLAMLRLLSVQPRILLLDEPTANLDEDNADKVESLVAQYLYDTSAAAIWVGHALRQLQRVANRHYRILQGDLVEVGTAA